MAQYPNLRDQLLAAAEGGSRPINLLSAAIQVLGNENGLNAVLQELAQGDNPVNQNPQIYRVHTDHIILYLLMR